MHVSLTDVLSCPRCGPGFGLVLLPARVEDRRVIEGVLGCANCRERYAVHGGIADLAVGGAASRPETPAAASAGGRERATRLAALLGLGEGGGIALVAGAWSEDAASLAAVVDGVEVVAVGERAGAAHSAIRASGALPFQTGSLRGVALGGEAATEWIPEGARVLRAGGRLVVESSADGVRDRVEAEGLRVVAQEGDTVVAQG